METINISALRHSAFYSPLLITISGGFLKEQGLEAHYEPQTAEKTVAERFAEGSIHMAQSAVATSFFALEDGLNCDIVHFAKINERDGFFLASRQPEPEFEWENLVGKDVLIDHLFQPLAMFRYALHKKGINEKQINIIDAGGVEQIDQAFRDGQGDYVHQQGPFPQQLEQEQLGHLVASVGQIVGPVAFSSLCATPRWLETDMAKAFMNAYRKALNYVIDETPAALAKQLSGFFPDIDMAVLTNTIKTYQAMGTWTTDPEISEQSYTNLIDIFLYNKIISKPHAMDECVVKPPD